MFRRKQQDAQAPLPAPPAPVTAETDAARVLHELLSKPGQEGLLEAALRQLAGLLGAADGPVRGYAVLRRGQDVVAAVHGYPRTLMATELNGPWAEGRLRVLSDGARELYAAAGPEVATRLDEAGMKTVAVTLVVPISDRGRLLGALILDRERGSVSPAVQEQAGRFGVALGPLLNLYEARDEWKEVARSITRSVVEAVESREFDSLGHARAVAEVALGLGRVLGLSRAEREELWYAATLHDLGKIHGESGHALVGANFVQDLHALAQAEKAIRHHHERWDGQGEPAGLAGEDIPLYARILAVANTYVRLGDLDRVKLQAGKALDPRLVEALGKVTLERRGRAAEASPRRPLGTAEAGAAE